MKISGNQDPALQSQSLLPVSLPKGGASLKSSDSKVNDAHPSDAPDSQSFSKLLDAGDADRSSAARTSSSQKMPSTAAGKKSALRDGARAPGRTGAGRSTPASFGSSAAAARNSASSSLSTSSDPRLTDSGSSALSSVVKDQGQQDGGSSLSQTSLNSDSAPLPPDPRLQQDPAELALEAAAIAAAQLLAAAAPAVSTSAPVAGDADAIGALSADASGGGSQSPSLGSPFAAQLALRNIQSSLKAGVAVSSPVVAGGTPSQTSASDAQQQASSAQVVVPQSVPQPAVPQLSVPLDSQSSVSGTVVSNSAPGLSGGSLIGVTGPSLALEEPSVSLEATLVSVSATSTQLSDLVSAARKNSAAVSQSAPQALGETVASLTASVPTLAQIQAQPFAAASSAALQAVGPQKEAFFAPPAQFNALGESKEGSSADSQSVSTTAQPLAESAVSGGLIAQDHGDASSDGKSKGQEPAGQGAQDVVTVKVAPDQVHRSGSSAPKVARQSGTLGANKSDVLSEAPTVRLSAEDNSAFQPARMQEGVPASVSDAGSGNFALGASGAGVGTRLQAESVSRPVVLPPAQVKANEVWKVVTDALQRARSENPSHLAVEVRMDDGSTLGLEVRMSSNGLQASFRSESQTLLKTLETQWNALVAKEPADSKVASAVFEGRTGFGSSTDSSSSGNERRQQLEDASASSSLARGSSPSKTSSTSTGAGTKQVTPSIRTRDGRVAVYA